MTDALDVDRIRDKDEYIIRVWVESPLTLPAFLPWADTKLSFRVREAGCGWVIYEARIDKSLKDDRMICYGAIIRSRNIEELVYELGYYHKPIFIPVVG